jgi:hypothetical protein
VGRRGGNFLVEEGGRESAPCGSTQLRKTRQLADEELELHKG